MEKRAALAFLFSLMLAVHFLAPISALSQYDSSWTRRTPVTIDNTLNPNNLVDYQVKINVQYDSDMKADFSDLRFKDSDGSTLLPYWVESYIASVSAVVWVKVPSIPGTGSKTIYMYYGDPAATSESNIRDTFVFGDDFNDGSLDASLWTESCGAYDWPYDDGPTPLPGGYVSETDGEVYVRTELTPYVWWVQNRYIVSASSFSTQGMAFDYKVRIFLGQYDHRTGLFILDRRLAPDPDGELDAPPPNNVLFMGYAWWGGDWLDIVKMTIYGEYPLFRGPWPFGEQYASLSIRLTDSEMAFLANEIEVYRGVNDLTFTTGYIYASTGGRGYFGPPYLNEAYFDDIRVRKYVEPEPVASVGAEESLLLVGLLNFDDYRNRMGSLTPMQPSTGFYFPHFHQDANWQTYIAIANPNDATADFVDVFFYSNDGTPLAGFDVGPIGPRCKIGLFLSQLGVTGTGWIGVWSAIPVVGLLNFDDYANRMGSMSGVTPATQIYFPHFHQDASWQTYYAVVNPSDITPADITITYYRADGTVITTEPLTLNPRNKIGRFCPVSGTGWIAVQSDQPIVGMLNFDDYANRMGSIEHATPSQTLYFPHFHQDASWETYYAIANPSDQTATVTITCYGNDGSIITTSPLTLGGYCKLGTFAVAGVGWIKVESDVPIVGILNFDDYRNRMGSIVATTPQSSIIFPHFHQDGNWETFYAIVNIGPSTTVTATYYRSDGSTITSIPATVAFNSKIGRFATSGVGWLRITPPS